MQPSEFIIEYIKGKESFSPVRYILAGVEHIGYGFNTEVWPNLPLQMTEAQADQFLREILQNEYAPIVLNKAVRPLSQNEFDALLSFVYNAGNANFSLWNAVNSNAPNTGEIWRNTAITSNGIEFPGLKLRRAQEYEIYSSSDNEWLILALVLIALVILYAATD